MNVTMADKQPLTRKDLLEALKSLPSEERVKEIVLEVSDIVLKGVDALIQEMRNETKSRFENVDNCLDKLEVELRHVKDTVNGLKADFSTAPSRREFNELKRRVDRYHPAN